MDISSATGTQQVANKQQSGTAGKSLGKDDFLRLLTAQLQAQNPLNPMDATGFTAQLAQFSSLEQMTNIDSDLKTLLAYQSSLQNTMATDLIGKKIKMTGNGVTLNGTAALNYSLQGNAAAVTLSIFNATGALVKSADLGKVAAGNNSFLWDGKDKNGNQLSAGGRYTFTLAATDSSGNAVTATPLTSGTVTSVAFDNNMTYLTIDGNTRIQLGDVREILGGN